MKNYFVVTLYFKGVQICIMFIYYRSKSNIFSFFKQIFKNVYWKFIVFLKVTIINI